MTDTKGLGVGKGFKNPRFQRIFNSKIHTSGSAFHTLLNNPEGVEKIKEIIKKETKSIRYKGVSNYKKSADLKKIKNASIAAGEEFTRADRAITKQLFEDRSTAAYAKAGTEENKAVAHGQFIYKRNIKPVTMNHNEHAITSIAKKFTTATVRRSGDTTKLTEQGQEHANTAVSISSVIKNKPASGATTPTKSSISNPNFKLNN